VTPTALAFVLHTQTAKLAGWPAFTCEAAEKDWTRTQRCGIFLLTGGGELVCEPEGVGVGLGELRLGLGLGLLRGVVELGEADGFLLGEFVGVELLAFVALGDLVGLGDLLGDFVGLGDLVGLAD
jgi:hypothetical protein